SCGASLPGSVSRFANAMTKEANTVPQPMMATTERGKARPKRPNMMKPASGRANSNGVSDSTSGLPLHRIEIVHVDLLARAEDGDDDRQAHDDLSGGNAQHQEDEDPTIHGVQRAGKRHERQVHRVEHQFDRHEDHQPVAPTEDADDAEREEDSAH